MITGGTKLGKRSLAALAKRDFPRTVLAVLPSIVPTTPTLTTQFLANRHSLFAFIYGFTRNTQDAEDLFQEVWVRFSEALERGVEIEDQARWCRGTARNLVLHYWRDRMNDKVVVDQELIDLVELAFEEEAGDQDLVQARQDALAKCLQALPDRSREILRLKYDEGRTAEEVARSVSQTTASVMMALSRLRRALRDCAEARLRLVGYQA